MKFNCLVINQKEKSCKYVQRELNVKDLNRGEVLIKTHYSGINYKDALGLTFTAPIYKQNEIIPGIDVSGVIYKSNSKVFKEGDEVLVNGMGLGESYDGGFSEYVKVIDKNIIKLPKGLTLKEAMVLGTSGFTAALAIERMIQNGQTWEQGPILVSGATGGVGQFAIQILNQLGFVVEAVTSRKEHINSLENLGAHYVSLLSEILSEKSRPLESILWGGAIDNLGGDFLTHILPRIELWGNVSLIGLALSSSLNTTVMPFILRGISLLGASSNNCTMDLREKIWRQLGQDWKPKKLNETLTSVITLDQAIDLSKKIIEHKHFGKTIIKF